MTSGSFIETHPESCSLFTNTIGETEGAFFGREYIDTPSQQKFVKSHECDMHFFILLLNGIFKKNVKINGGKLHFYIDPKLH